MPGIATHDRLVGVLVDIVEAEPQPETVGQRHLLLDGFGRVDRGRALVVDHVARHQMASVRRRVEDDIGRAPLDAAFKHRLQRFVAGVLLVEGKIVAEQDTAAFRPAQTRQ